jgi:hydrogenase maturation protein HypF
MTDPVQNTQLSRRRIHVDGVVQGVGFRPFIYGLAMRFRLTGWVLNSSSGVDIEVQGSGAAVAAFELAVTAEAPPLSRIDAVASTQCPLDLDDTSFSIRFSERSDGTSLIAPDVRTCPDCLSELFDPANRRYRYAFTNCTNCGPRYTIIQAMPYDRPLTTMSGFPMCPECRAEYENPLDRRFHAQPNACPTCGPQLELVVPGGSPWASRRIEGIDELARAATLICLGAVVAVKGLGGFHLACDATNEEAVARLRERKHRPDKPFAVMMRSLAEVRAHGQVSDEEAALLTEASAPVVLLYRHADSTIASNIAPDNPMIGVMLPYTPLHHLLLADAGQPLVMTSGNLSDMPIIKDDAEALSALAGIADAFLLHNRPIHMRCDDAVWWVDSFADRADAARQPLRRSRGDAPYPIRLKWAAHTPVLAVGAEMKNSLCLLEKQDAFVSQHIGEVSTLESLRYFREALDHLSTIFKIQPGVIAHDLHPGYLTTRLATELAAERGVPRIGVQHHHAHISACLAEHGRDDAVLGFAFDGTGYGSDGAIWGGEALIASIEGFERAAHLEYLPLPGGDAAIQRPYRIAWSYLLSTLGEIPDLAGLRDLSADERGIVMQQVRNSINAPLTSSMGRLFDAVAAMTGLCTRATFEGQAAIALELAARRVPLSTTKAYPFEIEADGVIRVGGLIAGIADDLRSGRPVDVTAAAFHTTIGRMIVTCAARLRHKTGISTAALSGGVFQNRLLLRLARDGLREAGFEVLTHRQVPANDGGLSLGQAVIAMRQG